MYNNTLCHAIILIGEFSVLQAIQQIVCLHIVPNCDNGHIFTLAVFRALYFSFDKAKS